MNQFFVIVNATTKLPVSFPDTTGLTNESQILQWIDDMVNHGGMGANQELVASYEPNVRPTVDERLLQVNEERAYNNTAHPVYTMLKQWLITYPDTPPLAVDIQKLAVDVKENEANETTIPYEKRLKMTVLAVDAIMTYLGLTTNDAINATSLTAKKKKRLRLFRKIANKIDNNDATRTSKHTQIDNAQLPDLNTNWDLDDYNENA